MRLSAFIGRNIELGLFKEKSNFCGRIFVQESDIDRLYISHTHTTNILFFSHLNRNHVNGQLTLNEDFISKIPDSLFFIQN